MIAQIDKAMRALLLASSAVASRIYPLKFPGDTDFPCVTYQHITTSPTHTRTSTPLIALRYQVTIWAKSYDDAMTTGAAVYAALNGYHGTINGVEITRCHLDDAQVLRDTDTNLYQYVMDYIITYRSTS
jgi:hypothetical protein